MGFPGDGAWFNDKILLSLLILHHGHSCEVIFLYRPDINKQDIGFNLVPSCVYSLALNTPDITVVDSASSPIVCIACPLIHLCKFSQALQVSHNSARHSVTLLLLLLDTEAHSPPITIHTTHTTLKNSLILQYYIIVMAL